MAKNPGPGFFDQHIEKVVLVICVIAALFCVWHFGASTPLRLEVPTGMSQQTESVPPAEVDSSLFDAAKRLENKINNAPAEEIASRNEVAMLKNFQEYPISGVELAGADFGVPMYKGKIGTRDTNVVTRLTTLEEVAAAMPAPAKPVSWTGIELLSIMDVTGDQTAVEGDLKEDAVWRGVTWYPMDKLKKDWEKIFSKTVAVPQFVMLGYEVEIQEQRADGKWQNVEDVKPFTMPETADATGAATEQPPVIPDFVVVETGESNTNEVRQAIGSLEQWMFVKLQPDYFDVWTQNGKISWRQHMPLETIKKLFAEKPKEETPAPAAPAAVPAAGRRDVRARAAAMAARMQADPGMMPPDMMMEPGMMPPGRAGAVTTYRARKARGAATPVAEGEAIPSEAEQFAAGKPLAWFHVNTIQFGKKYRCRFRWIFVNPLLTFPQCVKDENKADAAVKQIESPWSEWSDPICVTRKMEFFITGANSQKGELTVTVFTEVMGQLVRARFGSVGIGKEIGGNAEVNVLNPATGNRQKMQLNFDTGAIVVDLNFNRRVVALSGRLIKDAVEMVYADENGNVRSRLMYDDQNSPEYLALMDEADRNEPEKIKPAPAAADAGAAPRRRARAVAVPSPDMMPPPDFEAPGRRTTLPNIKRR